MRIKNKGVIMKYQLIGDNDPKDRGSPPLICYLLIFNLIKIFITSGRNYYETFQIS